MRKRASNHYFLFILFITITWRKLLFWKPLETLIKNEEVIITFKLQLLGVKFYAEIF